MHLKIFVVVISEERLAGGALSIIVGGVTPTVKYMKAADYTGMFFYPPVGGFPPISHGF